MPSQVHAEILMNIAPHETRVALIENGLLQEVHIERDSERGLLGNIYKGKVVRVLPGMQAAFIDIGLEKAGFLHVSNIMPQRPEEEAEVDMSSKEADIRRWLYDGQEVLVQVIKDPLGTKGARLTTHLSVVSRYLVYMPDLKHIGVSLRLQDPEERDRLLKLVGDVLHQEHPEGYIVRTVAEGVSDDGIQADVKFLEKLWKSVSAKAKKTKKPGLVYEELPLKLRALRDLTSANVEKVLLDNEQACVELSKFSKELVPSVSDKLEFFRGGAQIFEMYGVEDELSKALMRKVLLKSGGHVIFDQTEAMTTIDVNTGHYVGARNLEETTFKTNLEAVQTIVRQLRLRNLGGIIIIDFIDMQSEDHQKTMLSALERALETDPAKTYVTEVSSLGLVSMTRKRTSESLEQKLCETCPHCQGRAKVKSTESVIFDIVRELRREANVYQASGFLILLSQSVYDAFQNEFSLLLGEFEAELNLPIKLQVEAHYVQEQFDVIFT